MPHVPTSGAIDCWYTATATSTTTPTATATATPTLTLPPVFIDNFDDNSIDPTFWSPDVNGSGPSIAEVNQRLETRLPESSCSSQDFFNAGLVTTGKVHLGGDFDVQVDFSLLQWPANNGVRNGLNLDAPDGSFFCSVQRSSGSAFDVYVLPGPTATPPARRPRPRRPPPALARPTRRRPRRPPRRLRRPPPRQRRLRRARRPRRQTRRQPRARPPRQLPPPRRLRRGRRQPPRPRP